MEQKLVPALDSMLGFLSKDLTVLSIPRHHTPWSMCFMTSFHIVCFNFWTSNCYLIGYVGIGKEYFEGQVILIFTNSREDQGRRSRSTHSSTIEIQAVAANMLEFCTLEAQYNLNSALLMLRTSHFPAWLLASMKVHA